MTERQKREIATPAFGGQLVKTHHQKLFIFAKKRENHKI
jgi:hypothetical protein